MTKRTLILLTTVILLVAVGAAAYMMRKDTPAASQTANAPVATGISLVFDAPLRTNLQATVTNSDNVTAKTVNLEKAATRFNIDLPSGVYQVAITAPDNSIPPFTPETITVADGVLSELLISIPHEEEQ